MLYQANDFKSRLLISFESYIILLGLILKIEIGKDTRLCERNLVDIKITKVME